MDHFHVLYTPNPSPAPDGGGMRSTGRSGRRRRLAGPPARGAADARPPAASPGPIDPRQTYAGPYQNIHPDVRYVGDAQCGVARRFAKSFAKHPMARSLASVADLLDRQRDSPDVNNPFTALGRLFQVERQGQKMRHRQTAIDASGKPIVELTQDVRWAIGSGAKGYSFLSEQDGYLLETPISWYREKRGTCRRALGRRPWRAASCQPPVCFATPTASAKILNTPLISSRPCLRDAP